MPTAPQEVRIVTVGTANPWLISLLSAAHHDRIPPAFGLLRTVLETVSATAAAIPATAAVSPPPASAPGLFAWRPESRVWQPQRAHVFPFAVGPPSDDRALPLRARSASFLGAALVPGQVSERPVFSRLHGTSVRPLPEGISPADAPRGAPDSIERPSRVAAAAAPGPQRSVLPEPRVYFV